MHIRRKIRGRKATVCSVMHFIFKQFFFPTFPSSCGNFAELMFIREAAITCSFVKLHLQGNNQITRNFWGLYFIVIFCFLVHKINYLQYLSSETMPGFISMILWNSAGKEGQTLLKQRLDAEMRSIGLKQVGRQRGRAKKCSYSERVEVFKVLSLTPYVPIKGCNCVTFAGSIIFTHYAGADEIRSDTCLLRERLNNKQIHWNFVNPPCVSL